MDNDARTRMAQIESDIRASYPDASDDAQPSKKCHTGKRLGVDFKMAQGCHVPLTSGRSLRSKSARCT